MQTKFHSFDLPDDELCSGNCASCIYLTRSHLCSGYCIDCIYWDPLHTDWDTRRQYCRYYDEYFFPNERNGCLSKET